MLDFDRLNEAAMNVLIRYYDLAKVYAKTGTSSFGGWSTTALLLEKELVDKRKVLKAADIKGATTYAQILPGATQVSIVANTAYHLRGLMGSVVGTVAYLLPAISLITVFAACYFHFAHDTSQLMQHMDGLIAALSGIILANAYKIGSKHTARLWLWAFVIVAFALKLWVGVNALVIIVAFGLGGLILSWTNARKALR